MKKLYCKYCKKITLMFDKMPVRPFNKNIIKTKVVCMECHNEIR